METLKNAGLCLTLLTMSISSALGQESTSPERQGSQSETGEIESIQVTARKRVESVLDIPESISALNAEELERGAIVSLDDLGMAVGNLNLATRTDGNPNVTIRGVGSFGNTQGVGFYLDDVQLFTDASARLGDLQRVEVLKGPQGTLYGGSSIGGAVRFVSMRPEADEFFGRVKAVVGQQSTRDLEASFNIPLSDNGWAARVFGYSASNDGYLINTNPARINGGIGSNDADIGSYNEEGFKLAIAGTISDNFSAYATLRWNDLDSPNNPWAIEEDNQFSYNNERNFSFNPRVLRETIAATAEFELELDSMFMTAISGYTDTDFNEGSDLDATQEFVFDFDRGIQSEIFSQEVRFTSKNDGPTQWQAGLYYLSFERDTQSDLIAHGSGNAVIGYALAGGPPPTAAEESISADVPLVGLDVKRQQYATFVTGSHEIGNFVVDLGARFERWDIKGNNTLTAIAGDTGNTEFLPKASLSYKLSDNGSNIYITASKGFEPGGLNPANFTGKSELFSFGSEKTTNLEVGYKGRLLDNRMTIATALFYIDYSGRQFELTRTDPSGNPIEGILNAGKSTQYGWEAELSYSISDHLIVGLSAGLVEAEWDEGTLLDDGTDLSGLTPPYINKSTAALTLDYNKPISEEWEFFSRLQASYKGEFEADLFGRYQNPSYSLFNLGFGVAKENVELAIEVENLFDKQYYSDVSVFPNFNFFIPLDSVVIGTLAQPRLITARATIRF
ncbi:TonB-dependent receptor [Bowmanella pacifica]|uniref:TonB-dependent receptor n=1 Tax=Bowmanella pacifica TaxID=502051 RepID=A0A917YXN2_9ALTE|nr:TonB-dependent receptor [Bowmanella pacifica]GGO67101.1 TonB-dependent receptor [Bowmanella pacifica]